MMRYRFLILVTICFGLFTAAAADEIKVRMSGGTEKIEAVGEDDAIYFSLSHLRTIIGGEIEWQRPGYAITYVLDDNMLLFHTGSPFVRINDSLYNMILPAKIIAGALFVPAETFTPLLNIIRPENITWDQEGKTLRIDAEWFNITDMRISSKQNGLLVEIFMTTQLQFEVYQSEGNWINIDFPMARINRSKILASLNRNYVRKINAFQFENSAQISFRPRKGFKSIHSTYRTDPGRLQIAIESDSYEPDSVLTASNRIGPDEKIDVIVIDAGHGGKDYGAIGKSQRTREKDITLAIAKELAKMIRAEKQFKVIMTRSRDDYVSLDERAKIANDAQADLFVSIHCNASTKSSANGHEVFYLAPAKSDAARAVAQFENAPFLLDNASVDKDSEEDLAFILNDMIQTEFITESADLAGMVDLEMRKNTKIDSRGVDHAGFFVLNRVYMPSVLVESAFISNYHEEKLLRDDDFRKKVAEAIYKAVLRFKAKYERI